MPLKKGWLKMTAWEKLAKIPIYIATAIDDRGCDIFAGFYTKFDDAYKSAMELAGRHQWEPEVAIYMMDSEGETSVIDVIKLCTKQGE